MFGQAASGIGLIQHVVVGCEGIQVVGNEDLKLEFNVPLVLPVVGLNKRSRSDRDGSFCRIV